MYCTPPTLMRSNQTYYGSILGLRDALLILEGIRQEVLPQVNKRLNDAERKMICAGAIFAWNEATLGMKRWTDGKNWLASKVKGPFLIYFEHDTERNLKPNGLVKQSFSLTTKQGDRLHLIAYYNPQDRMAGILRGEVPSQDPLLLKFQLDPSVYRSDFLNSGAREVTVLPAQNPMYEYAPQNVMYRDYQEPVMMPQMLSMNVVPGRQYMLPNAPVHNFALNRYLPRDEYEQDSPRKHHKKNPQAEFYRAPVLKGPESRNCIRTLPSLSESFGKLEPVPKGYLSCSKSPDQETFKIRLLDKTFSV